jgi:hypothetical protein
VIAVTTRPHSVVLLPLPATQQLYMGKTKKTADDSKKRDSEQAAAEPSQQKKKQKAEAMPANAEEHEEQPSSEEELEFEDGEDMSDEGEEEVRQPGCARLSAVPAWHSSNSSSSSNSSHSCSSASHAFGMHMVLHMLGGCLLCTVSSSSPCLAEGQQAGDVMSHT